MSQQPITGKGKKAILLVHEKLYGGGSRQSLFILQALVAQGYEAVIISNARDSWFGQNLKKSGLNVKAYYTPWIQRTLNPFKDLMVLFYLAWVFLREKPDLILSAGVKLIGMGAFVGWLCRVPARFAIIRGQGAAQGTRLIRCIYAMERVMAWLGTRFITVCEYNRQEMLNEGICSPDRIITIHNGTDVPASATRTGWLRQRLGIHPNACLVGMVGRFTPQKRYDLFIEMAANLCRTNPNVYAVLVGDGAEHEALQRQIDETGFADRIFMVGFCDDIAAVYPELDVSILFSRYEGCANALLESAAAGLPIVAEAVCGNPEIVIHNQTGYIIEPCNVAQAVHYVQRLVDDPGLRARMGAAGRQRILQYFNRETQIQKLIETIDHWEQAILNRTVVPLPATTTPEDSEALSDCS